MGMLRAVPRRHTVIGLGVVAIVGVRLFGELHGRTVSRRPLSSTTSMPHFSGVDTYDAPGQHSATLIFLHGLGDTVCRVERCRDGYTFVSLLRAVGRVGRRVS